MRLLKWFKISISTEKSPLRGFIRILCMSLWTQSLNKVLAKNISE